MNNDGEQDKMVLMEISILRHNFNTDLWRLDLSESGQSSCQIDSDVRLANLLVSLIIDGKYEQALDEGKKLNLFSSVDAWCSKVGDELCKNVHNYVSTSEPSSSIRPLTILCVAVASLELFVQNNWLGPPTKSSPLSVLGDSFLEEERTGNLTNHIQTSLTLDGDLFSSSAKCSLYLYIARSILLQCKDDIAECLTSEIWQLRCVQVHQRMLAERSSALKTLTMDLIEQILKKEKIMANDEYRDLAIQCHLTAGHMCYFYYEPRQAKEHFSQAEKLSGLDIKLTGVLGKRTHFQERDISQLMLEVKHSDSIQPWASDEATSIPVNVRLDDDTLLDSLPLVNKDKQLLTPMSAIQQAVVLALCYNHRHSKEISQIVQEESEAFITIFSQTAGFKLLQHLGASGLCLASNWQHPQAIKSQLINTLNWIISCVGDRLHILTSFNIFAVLYRPQCWAVQTMALLMRSLSESASTRKMQRALSQIEELVSQYRRGDPGASDRLYLIYTLNMPTVWEIEIQLAALFEKVGAIQAALEVYLRIEAWEEVIKCYAQLGKKEKADKLVREQLLINDKPLLWCYLGDIHDSEEYYLKAVDLSKGKFGRALRSLAYLKLHRKQFSEALKYFEKSLEVNGLQIGVWFSYGCTALRVENYNLAAKAFRTCVNLDTDNYEAWNNLATAYIKSNQKVRAFAILQEAIKCEFENWRLWENYLLVGIDIGEFGEVIQAYHRLLDLKDKHCDVQVLEMLVKAIRENLQDAAGQDSKIYRLKALELFGRITSKITSSAAIWRLYAELTAACRDDISQVEREKMLQYLQKAHRCSTLTQNWEKEVKTCNDVLEQSVHLAKVYLQCCTKVEDKTSACQMLTSAKLMIKGVLSKIKQQQTDPISGELRADIKQLYTDLEEQLTSVMNMIDERKPN